MLVLCRTSKVCVGSVCASACDTGLRRFREVLQPASFRLQKLEYQSRLQALAYSVRRWKVEHLCGVPFAAVQRFVNDIQWYGTVEPHGAAALVQDALTALPDVVRPPQLSAVALGPFCCSTLSA